MAVDKSILQLPTLPADLLANDTLIAVRSGVDYQFTGQQLLNLVAAVVAAGSVVSFTNTIPANTVGKNGDVIIKPGSGDFWQKVAGTWAIQYTVPAAGTGNAVLYGIGVPAGATGNIGDTFIRTDGGIFYKKTAATVWTASFTMATGPAGATGAAGTAGTNGTNGKSVLNGTTPPSNTTTGTDGDFYINTSSFFIYGPKAAGVWPAGLSLISSPIKQAYNYPGAQFAYNSTTLVLTFTLTTADQQQFPLVGFLNATLREKINVNSYKIRNSFDPIVNDNGTNYTTVVFEGVDSTLINNTQIILN